MTEYVMKNGVLVPGTSRRTFMKALGTLFTGAVVAPVIVPYSQLMHIDSPTNKLIFAYTSGYNGNKMTPSFLNLGEVLDPIIRSQWEGQNPQNHYSLVRQAEIHPDKVGHFGNYKWSRYSDEEHREAVQRLKRRIEAFRAGAAYI